ncbi:hypothetical protein PENSPDRAFT_674059 [Peniophora sp. CONT]|nr:hypothetical protein PENSPDRAFT_674059 [Peniophora sp. CONT]
MASSEYKSLSLDEHVYSLDAEESEFLKQWTGISDDAELKNHILTKQREAYAVAPYPCIRGFGFTKLKISRLFPYKQLLQLQREKPKAILLDIGCCFGNDIRKAVADGWPASQALGTDIEKELWDIGYTIYKDSPETFPVPFIVGDAFSPSHLDVIAPWAAPPSSPAPDLKTLTSLNPLRGHVSAIHASSLFHLFTEEDQARLAARLAGLLSHESGSMIFGQHVGQPVTGNRVDPFKSGGGTMFCYNPEDWEKLWEGVFSQSGVKVAVRGELNEVPREDQPPEAEGKQSWRFTWSVTRL